ncbi:MAG: hypothetical protein U5K00_02420 [Melioribacteraceae bacterium]|nr:hypothetical protein [Melioribacteraceae bacterium]
MPDNFQNNLSEFSSNVIITDEVINSFKIFLQSKNVEINENEFSNDIGYIKDILKAYLARDIFNSKGWYMTLLNQDEPFREALLRLNEAKEMLKNY